MTVALGERADETLVEAMAHALVDGALPGELDSFGPEERGAAARFLLDVAADAGTGAAIRVEPLETGRAGRWLRIGIVSPDRPFLVDSSAAAVTAAGLTVGRLLHPILNLERGASGAITALAGEEARATSLIYLEAERTDERAGLALEAELARVLAEGDAAVADWTPMQAALRQDARAAGDGEGAALVDWLVDRHMTLLGHARIARDGGLTEPLGLCRLGGEPLLDEATRADAFAWFERGGSAPLLLKSSRISLVHRRSQLDLVLVPDREGGEVRSLSVQAGLWTSAALAAPATDVPVLRTRLEALRARLRFGPASHAGKALRQAFSTLPHDLSLVLAPADLERIALTAMGLSDRPRPKLVLAAPPVGDQLFALAWLPREALTTARRERMAALIAEASSGTLVDWAVESGDGTLALVRFVFHRPAGATAPDEAALDRALDRSVRGWGPALEERLADLVGPAEGAVLAQRFAAAFPPSVRLEGNAGEAAADIVRLAALVSEGERGVRLHLDETGRLHLKLFRLGGTVPLSDAVPAFENFGFRVLDELPLPLAGALGTIHDFLVEVSAPEALLARADAVEGALAAVLEGRAENDAFNRLLAGAGIEPQAVVLFRAWFRYLRQTGLTYGLSTVVDALARAPKVTRALHALFLARHGGTGDEAQAVTAIDAGLALVAALDDDRILRRLRNLVTSILRTNAFAPAGAEALAFKLDSQALDALPAPRPWREIWVYSPRLEGIHLRGGPVARGGLRWSDRRDDFRTEILGLMKAQVVKNAVIVPTGAKGGFYPKQLPSPADRGAWMAEGTESYRIFIRALLSVTDNLVDGHVVHPDGVRILDGDDPYFVVAADKGTATFSDVANAIALEHGFWLGDAFASGGSNGYDHKAMGITARGAWVSVARHFAEAGVDVQADPVTVAGCGDMSGDVFGNGMLLSRSLRLVAAFDHRHIFLDPSPDPEASWAERKRLFDLPRSSWDDYDKALISPGGGVWPRTAKSIPLSTEAQAALGISADALEPAELIAAILKAPVDLLWFGGIGTYVKVERQSHAEAGDPANDSNRVDASTLRASVIGEGANLGLTQAARIEFAMRGGRINTDFIDNSAGVDCSDNEVNIKIALNTEVAAGRLTLEARNTLLIAMTDDVAAIVLEDNRLQTLALSLAQRGGASALPAQLRVAETLEASGRLDRRVEGLASNEELARRAADGRGLTRPELAVLTSFAKLALQDAIERAPLAADPALTPIVHAAFPPAMRARFAAAIDRHRLRGEIAATKLANEVVNRLGFVAPFELAEEEGASLAQVAAAYVAVDSLFDLGGLWRAIETAAVAETARLQLFELGAGAVRLHLSDMLRAMGNASPSDEAARLRPRIDQLAQHLGRLLRSEARAQRGAVAGALERLGTPDALAERLTRLIALDGAIGLAALAAGTDGDALATTEAYVRLGETLGLDWAKVSALALRPVDPWERLLAASLARDFEQLRLDFLGRHGGGDPVAGVSGWLAEQEPRVAQFRRVIDRARAAPAPTAPMLAQIAGQARLLLGR